MAGTTTTQLICRGVLFAVLLTLCCPGTGLPAADFTEKTLKTKFTTIFYGKDEDLAALVWRLSGKRLGPEDTRILARKRVDWIVERVQLLLGLYPFGFHLDIYLMPQHYAGDIAFYSHDRRSITVDVDRSTDGVLAHEIAHAVVNAYFEVPPPRQTQEILAQYVDRQLWRD